MPVYITLYKFTQKGATDIKEMPEAIKRTKKRAEELGIKTMGVWVTMGEYDLVAVGDARNEEAIAELALRVARAGLVTSQTMRAFTEDEFAALVGKLPED